MAGWGLGIGADVHLDWGTSSSFWEFNIFGSNQKTVAANIEKKYNAFK